MLNRLAEESRNKERGKEIICPYCKSPQDNETQHHHVSYWGEDSKNKIECESCGREFWVEEIVERTFETTMTEWEEKNE